MLKMSATLEQMIVKRRGYRTESYSGSNVRNIIDIIREELSMGNTDIVSYMQSVYGILKEYSPCKTTKCEDISYLCQENVWGIIDEITGLLKELLRAENTDDITGLWLTDYEHVISIYGGVEGDIDEYVLPNNDQFKVISDLGIDGSLFVFSRHAIPYYNKTR